MTICHIFCCASNKNIRSQKGNKFVIIYLEKRVRTHMNLFLNFTDFSFYSLKRKVSSLLHLSPHHFWEKTHEFDRAYD